MDLYPLYNSLRVALIATAAAFIIGLWFAVLAQKLPRIWRGVIDVVFTLPLVLPPTVVGFFLLKLTSPKSLIGGFVLEMWNIRLAMQWYSAIFASAVVAFPLMYRTVRGAIGAFDHTLVDAGRTLGLSDTKIFWRITFPNCRSGIIAGSILTFARALGEYGATSMVAGYTPGRTATISTTVYQLWRTDQEAEAYKWVLINVAISFVMLVALNMFEKRETRNA